MSADRWANVRILVVDDDKAVRTTLQVLLSKRALKVVTATNADEALELLKAEEFDLVITDVKMPGPSGLDLLQQIRESSADLPVIVMTGNGTVSDAVAAMKAGASDYVLKPIEKDNLYVILGRAIETRAMRAELVQLRRQVQRGYGFKDIIGTTPIMQRLYEDLAAVADTSATVLIQGPTGTGKELVASALHHHSRRAAGPFVPVNCAAIPETLLESELFGHEKGSFSGAIRTHHGRFEQAHGGTIFLDEIGEIDAFMQVKLLRVLQDSAVQRVGGGQPVKVDVRVVAATNRDLRKEVEAGRFRQDLYYRLNVVMLKIPTLRERREDIPLLAEHFIQKYAEKNDRPVPQLQPASLERLMAYSWPGNVRQLEHVIERAVILNRDERRLEVALPDDDETVAPLPPSALPPAGMSLQDALESYERELLVAALEEADGVQAQAARRLGISRSNLNYRIGRLGIRLTGVRYE